MIPRRLAIILALALLLTAALLPAAGRAPAAAAAVQPPAPQPAPQPPASTWEARRHPEKALDAPATPAGGAPAGGASAAAGAPPAGAPLAGPDLFPFEQWSRIAFQSFRDNNWEVYVALANGAEPRRVTHHPKLDMRPRLDPNAERVAWVSDRDGNYEIYAANIDGSNERRLTDQIWEDDDPVWSPDGKQIAFTSRRDGDYDIYVMNPDGSGLRQLTDLPGDDFSPTWAPGGAEIAWIHATGDVTGEILTLPVAGGAPAYFAGPFVLPGHLAWSPDGSKIAFDAITDQSGWSKAAIAERGGTWHALSFSEWQSDVWMGSWSPEGSRLMVTLVRYVVYNGRWYIESLRMHRLTDYGYNEGPVAGSGLDALPDWKSLDRVPPRTRILPLPRFSHNSAILRWTATDGAGVGIDKVEIEMIVNGTSNGVREVASQDSSYLEVSGQPGDVMRYRLRGIDGAGNKEAWNNTYSETTFYGSRLSGRALDVREQPVSGALAHVAGPSLGQEPSTAAAPFATYMTETYGKVDVSWTAAPYLPLPATTVTRTAEAKFDVIFPSPDNLLPNWGFEDAGLAGWQAGGDAAPVADATRSHTGAGSARLGLGAPPSPQGESLGANAYHQHFSSGVDASGRAYILGGHSSSFWWRPLRLTVVNAAGAVEKSEEIYLEHGQALRPTISVSPAGVVDVIYVGNASYNYMVAHKRRNLDGSWTPTYTAPASENSHPAMAVDAAGNVHLISDGSAPNHELTYYHRNAAGGWDAPVVVAALPAPLGSAALAVDGLGRVHAVWCARTPTSSGDEIVYAMRDAAGKWTAPETLRTNGIYGQVSLVADAAGRAQLFTRLSVDLGGMPAQIVYSERSPDGAWTHLPLDITNGFDVAVAQDKTGALHAVWGRQSDVAYWHRGPGEPAPTNFASTPAGNLQAVKFAVRDGAAYVAWLSGQDWMYPEMRWGYATRDGWRSVAFVGRRSNDEAWTVAAPPGAGALLAWQAGDAGPRYLQPAVAGSDGVSRLSRTVTIPAAMPAPTLSLMLDLDKPWADPRGAFEARVRDASGKTTALLTSGEPTTGWQHKWFDLTPWQGQTVTVELESAWQRGGPLMHAYADELTLGSGAHADTWVAASAGGILPGQTGRVTLAYGNRGDVDAADAALRVTLPAGVTLVAANPPGAAEGGEWVWRPAALPAGATGRVEVDLRNDTASGDPGRLRATITPGPGEIQTGNNATAAMVWGRARGWLPRVGR